MERGNFLNDLIGGRMKPRVILEHEVPFLTARMAGEPPRCVDPDSAEPLSLQDLCWALVLRGAPDCSLQVHWPDRTPAIFVASIHECAAFSEHRKSPGAPPAVPPAQPALFQDAEANPSLNLKGETDAV